MNSIGIIDTASAY